MKSLFMQPHYKVENQLRKELVFMIKLLLWNRLQTELRYFASDRLWDQIGDPLEQHLRNDLS